MQKAGPDSQVGSYTRSVLMLRAGGLQMEERLWLKRFENPWYLLMFPHCENRACGNLTSQAPASPPDISDLSSRLSASASRSKAFLTCELYFHLTTDMISSYGVWFITPAVISPWKDFRLWSYILTEPLPLQEYSTPERSYKRWGASWIILLRRWRFLLKVVSCVDKNIVCVVTSLAAG